MHGRKENKRRIALYSGNYPDNIYIYRVDNPKRDTCCFLCISDSGIVDNRTSFQYLKENSQFLTVEDLKNRQPFQMSNLTNYILNDYYLILCLFSLVKSTQLNNFSYLSI